MYILVSQAEPKLKKTEMLIYTALKANYIPCISDYVIHYSYTFT